MTIKTVIRQGKTTYFRYFFGINSSRNLIKSMKEMI
ncbi:unnamed protein product [Schistosoma curassoni]|uniref:Transposase n=1 Tax=Schistosoma curassoni TaxID=6186 RepID=A0A183JMQ0_9TREM|nr:unnamed protein product [Schistosoma curassoni]